ncbi:MAG TPA: helix-turn-helix transcriptional regulator [Thermoanaerobaculia bacterium]|nr:helix-turn-helix transcriptional regulator [Thermoanaerobaculia bacterium]
MGQVGAIDRWELADRLRSRRLALEMSQQHVADASGLDRTQISKYERAEHAPGADALRCLAVALETTTDHLLGGLSDGRSPVVPLPRRRS